MIEMKSMAVAMPEVVGHPNRAAFEGVLTMVDMPSHRAPSGAKGHLVVLTRRAAEAALPSLLGMALDYSPSLDRHDVRRKVGVITRAEIVGRNLELGGHLFARDFPEIVEEIAKSRVGSIHRTSDSIRARLVQAGVIHAVSPAESANWREGCRLRASLRAAAGRILHLTAAMRRNSTNTLEQSEEFGSTIRAETCVAAGPSGLGLSYEVTGVEIADTKARVWTLSKVTFTGAAILRKDKAAYRDTWIELA
ncbi:MAG TPA: hypothetical protein VNX26_06685 [Candidatus Acidoferrum sp.]|jgi:hypothetical protein|nr:hypothetical protein [Candidatus Acidoferrum sp.]